MVLRVGHDRGFQQASLVPSPPPILSHVDVSGRYIRGGFPLYRADGIHPSRADFTFPKGGLFMQRRLGLRAVQLPACRHPVCLARAGLPEAGRRMPWDGNMT